jgi:hypothetical protein
MRAIGVLISPELILMALPFPEGTQVKSVNKTERPGEIYVVIEHSGLPELAEGQEPPLCKPLFGRNEQVVYFKDWGIVKNTSAGSVETRAHSDE